MYKEIDNYLTYIVKVSFNITLILSICATFVLNCFLLSSSVRIIVFCLSISFILARNYRQYYFINDNIEKIKNNCMKSLYFSGWNLRIIWNITPHFIYRLAVAWFPQLPSSNRFPALLQIGDHHLDYPRPFFLLVEKITFTRHKRLYFLKATCYLPLFTDLNNLKL